MPKRQADPEIRVGPARRNRRQWVVVSYDIPDDKRRTQIMKTLQGYGHRVQYSVFECELRARDLRELERRLRKLMNREQDDIRFYPLCEICLRKVQMLGKAERTEHEPYVVV